MTIKRPTTVSLLYSKFIYKGATFLLFILFLSSYSHAQLFDSIANSLKNKPKFYFKLDNRSSFISSKKASISGIKIGFEYKKRVALGIGLNTLSNDIYQQRVLLNEAGFNDIFQMKLHFNYVSPFIEYVFYRSKKWEHAIPVQIGFGNSKFQYTNSKGEIIKEHYKPIILYEPSMTTQYKFIRWAAIGGGLGYRILLLNNKEIKEKFNSPVYVIKLNIFWYDIYKRVMNIPPEEE